MVLTAEQLQSVGGLHLRELGWEVFNGPPHFKIVKAMLFLLGKS